MQNKKILIQKKKVAAKENMKTVSFQIRPSEYKKLQKLFESLGLTTGAGLRYALMEFKKSCAAKSTGECKKFSIN